MPAMQALAGDVEQARSSTHQELSSRPKRKRNSRACDRCHKNASKPSSKRSRPADDDAQSAETNRLSAEDAPVVLTPEDEDIGNERRNLTDNDGDSSPQFHTTLEHEVVEGLVDVFYYVGYPLRPYFHWPTFRSQVEQKKYQSEWGVFIVTMAVCCFAAGRLNDGIPIPSGLHNLRAEASLKSTECHNAAMKVIPKELTEVTDWYSLMKAKSLLASACLHNEQLKKALFHGGDYVSLSVSRGFHDEANWPEDLNEFEKQERRRLFWGSYQHDQHLAKMFGFISRHREAKAAVQYPSEVYDDTDIAPNGIQQRPTEVTSFLQGWNFCTDLYRILEQIDACSRFDRQTSVDSPGGKVTAFLACRQSPKVLAADSLRLLAQLYEDLPDDLKRIKAITGDPQKDRLGFIASNILLTLQTLRMVLVGSEKPSVHLHCAIATELLDEISMIPLAFFHASSTVTLHNLAQVGHMLAGVIQQPVSAWTYLHVRNILLVLAEFLERVETTRSSSPGLAAKLRVQMRRIDKCMQQLSQRNPEGGLSMIGRTLLSERSNVLQMDLPDNVDSPTSNLHLTSISEERPETLSPGRVDGSFLQNLQTPFNQQSEPLSYSMGQTLTDMPEAPLTNGFDLLASSLAMNPQHDLSLLNTAQYTLPNDLFSNWPLYLGPGDI
ncbi:nuclear protein [Colletotrichum asianum]